MTELTLTPVVPTRDVPLIHAWAIEERAKYWGMGDYTLEQVLEVYEFIDSLTTHDAYLVRWRDVPVALFQTYEPAADPVSDFYDVVDGDFGIHLMIGPSDESVQGFTIAIFEFLADWVFDDPTRLRVVVEPDARNDRARRRFCRLGFEEGARIELPEKPAQLAFLTREKWESARVSV